MTTTTGFKQDNQGSYILKDPQAKLNYAIDWSDWLGADTITSSTWAVTSFSTSTVDTTTLAVNSSSISANTTTIAVVTGGTSGNIYNLTNKVWTNNSLIERRSFRVKVEDRRL